jgi:hypothetical protein
MKKQTKTINQHGAVKTPRPKRAGKLLSLGLGVATVFTPLAATGCKMETEYVDVPVPTYPEITIPIRFFSETMDVTCPGDLIGESYTKINGAIVYMEAELTIDVISRNKILNLLSTNDVKIIVKNDGSVENCQKTGPFAMTMDYQWLKTSNVSVIGDIMIDTLRDTFAKAKDIQLDKVAQERKSACHRFC